MYRFLSTRPSPAKNLRSSQHVQQDVGKQIHQESNPPVWFGFEIPDANQFCILGLFPSEEDSQARLMSEAAQTMRANARAMFAVPPEVMKLDVIAAKF